MTIIKKSKEYIVDGCRYFVEQYQHKEMAVPLWRYGERFEGNLGRVLKDGLRARPNVKRLFGTVSTKQ